ATVLQQGLGRPAEHVHEAGRHRFPGDVELLVPAPVVEPADRRDRVADDRDVAFHRRAAAPVEDRPAADEEIAVRRASLRTADVEELATHASIPVINGLTDSSHPCQALADLMTIRARFGRLEGLKVVYLGDGNNVCASLMVACAKLGAGFVAATPPEYRPAEEAVRIAREAGGSVELTDDPRGAVEG